MTRQQGRRAKFEIFPGGADPLGAIGTGVRYAVKKVFGAGSVPFPVIASQALITAAFSVTEQVIQLGYLPRLKVKHTSVRETGPICIPFVNRGRGHRAAVVIFRSSGNLPAAYSVAVTLDMLITPCSPSS